MNPVFIDTNLPMYAAGREHPHRLPAIAYLRRVAEGDVAAATDAEVFQEILHRYKAIDRLADGLAIYESFRTLVPVVFPVTIDAVDDARSLLRATPSLSSRGALHVAVMRRAGIQQIVSFDGGFDGVKGIRRLTPR